MLEWNGTFAAASPGEWRWVEVRAADMLLPPNKHAPKFGPPWVALLLIFNRYTVALGLRVAELRVRPPGA